MNKMRIGGADELRLARRLWDDGATPNEIAERMGVSAMMARRFLYGNGLQFAEVKERNRKTRRSTCEHCAEWFVAVGNSAWCQKYCSAACRRRARSLAQQRSPEEIAAAKKVVAAVMKRAIYGAAAEHRQFVNKNMARAAIRQADDLVRLAIDPQTGAVMKVLCGDRLPAPPR